MHLSDFCMPCHFVTFLLNKILFSLSSISINNVLKGAIEHGLEYEPTIKNCKYAFLLHISCT